MKLKFIDIFAIFFIIVLIIIVYKKYEINKEYKEHKKDPYHLIKQYLYDNSTKLDKDKIHKPILWIHVPYEYNSRKWENWGSRSSFDLNEPYLYLTVKSIIKNCKKSFHICIIDDKSLENLVPDWNINMSILGAPISNNMRTLGLIKLIYNYGGMLCPISFLCFKNLIGLYNTGTRGGKMFVCENVSRTINSTHNVYGPDISFFGAPPKNEQVRELCGVVSTISGIDYTAQSHFLGKYQLWCKKRVKDGKINLISAKLIGRKSETNMPILIENLLGSSYIKIDSNAYGIYIPNEEILNRLNYEWFARMSPKQIIESNTMLGNYFLLVNIPYNRMDEPVYIESFKEKKRDWIGFWKTPLIRTGLYGNKPNFLGDNLQMKK